MTARAAIVPPASIGMLGGGQLGRYTLIAARMMGYRTVVVDPAADAPAGAIADEHLAVAYDDPAVVERLGECAVVTTEFENPPAGVLEQLAGRTRVAPNPRAVAIAQDRIDEKRFLTHLGLRAAPWARLVTAADAAAVGSVGMPAIVKTARLGYDGKGQIGAESFDEVMSAWERLERVPCVVERRLPLDVEVSAIVARGSDGDTVAYPLAANEHGDGILDVSVVPAPIAPAIADEALAAATEIAAALDYIGVLAVEFFISGGELFVNEIAPRPHNSGHWTLDAAHTDQFAQQLRAVTGAALGEATMTSPTAVMVNLLGDLWTDGQPDWSGIVAAPRAHLHLYGKTTARPGRKMGHLTLSGDGTVTAGELRTRAIELRAAAGGRRVDTADSAPAG